MISPRSANFSAQFICGDGTNELQRCRDARNFSAATSRVACVRPVANKLRAK
jgi:hypothetical protein